MFRNLVREQMIACESRNGTHRNLAIELLAHAQRRARNRLRAHVQRTDANNLAGEKR
jgi:hypothetical protein